MGTAARPGPCTGFIPLFYPRGISLVNLLGELFGHLGRPEQCMVFFFFFFFAFSALTLVNLTQSVPGESELACRRNCARESGGKPLRIVRRRGRSNLHSKATKFRHLYRLHPTYTNTNMHYYFSLHEEYDWYGYTC